MKESEKYYKAGMMQGFRILQSFVPFQKQKEIGFMGNGEKINKRLESEWQNFKNYVDTEAISKNKA